MPKPPGVMNSAFDTGAAPSVKRRAPRSPPLDPQAVRVETDVPIPERTAKYSFYAVLAARMAVGAMVRLPSKQAYGLVGYLKRERLPHVRRCLSPDVHGVWRTAAWPTDAAAAQRPPATPAGTNGKARPAKHAKSTARR